MSSYFIKTGLFQDFGKRPARFWKPKFDPADANRGVFFVGGAGATRAEVVGRNKPGELMFLVPASLASGDYTLEVRAVIYGGEEVRSGALAATLSVT